MRTGLVVSVVILVLVAVLGFFSQQFITTLGERYQGAARELLALQDQADSVYIKPEVVDYMVALVSATRSDPMILRGASPRATLSMASMAKAVAQSSAVRVLLPVNKCDNLIVGTGGFTVSELIDQAVETVKNIVTGC